VLIMTIRFFLRLHMFSSFALLLAAARSLSCEGMLQRYEPLSRATTFLLARSARANARAAAPHAREPVDVLPQRRRFTFHFQQCSVVAAADAGRCRLMLEAGRHSRPAATAEMQRMPPPGAEADVMESATPVLHLPRRLHFAIPPRPSSSAACAAAEAYVIPARPRPQRYEEPGGVCGKARGDMFCPISCSVGARREHRYRTSRHTAGNAAACPMPPLRRRRAVHHAAIRAPARKTNACAAGSSRPCCRGRPPRPVRRAFIDAALMITTKRWKKERGKSDAHSLPRCRKEARRHKDTAASSSSSCSNTPTIQPDKHSTSRPPISRCRVPAPTDYSAARIPLFQRVTRLHEGGIAATP